MKPNLLLLFVVCLFLASCSRDDVNIRELRGELAEIKTELAAHKPAPSVRWAFASKLDIDAVITQYANHQLDEFKKTETLTPELAEKLHQFEALDGQLMHMHMAQMGANFSPRRLGALAPAPEAPPSGKEIEAMAQLVTEARAPVADILDRRAKVTAQFKERNHFNDLLAEYVKDRYDLVVDSSRFSPGSEKVLYRASGEVPDITEGVIAFIKQKQNGK